MPVRIRLQRRGRRKAPYYHIVIADVRAPRDGRFIEKIGMYNPMTRPATIELDTERALDWLMRGAQPTDTARAILRFKGVLYKKHLARGVAKGVLTQEEADQKYNTWIADKEAKVAARVKKTKEEEEAFRKHVSGVPKPIVEKIPEPEETPAETTADAEGATEATPEETPAEEAAVTEKEAAAEETPVSEAEETAEPEAEESVEPETEESAPAEPESAKEESTESDESQGVTEGGADESEATTVAGAVEEGEDAGAESSDEEE